jgi:outer membrane protein assembly factor BamB
VVYFGSGDGKLYAFSAAAGSTHCSGNPPNRTCTPLWTGGSSGITYASPAVAHGLVYEAEWDAPFLYAFSR